MHVWKAVQTAMLKLCAVRHRGRISGILVAAGLLAGSIYFFRPRPHARSASAASVDPKRCAACHSQIAESYGHTGMGRSFHRTGPEDTAVKAGKPATFYHKASDSYLSMVEHGGQLAIPPGHRLAGLRSVSMEKKPMSWRTPRTTPSARGITHVPTSTVRSGTRW